LVRLQNADSVKIEELAIRCWPPCIPNKPIDYMGLGLPVISSVSGQLHDMIEKYDVGKNYEAGNPKDLAKRIVWFHSNRGRLKEMGENACRLVKQAFLADDISNSYADFLVQIAKNSQREIQVG